MKVLKRKKKFCYLGSRIQSWRVDQMCAVFLCRSNGMPADARIFNMRTDVNVGDCENTITESAQDADSWRKIPCSTGGSAAHRTRHSTNRATSPSHSPVRYPTLVSGRCDGAEREGPPSRPPAPLLTAAAVGTTQRRAYPDRSSTGTPAATPGGEQGHSVCACKNNASW